MLLDREDFRIKELEQQRKALNLVKEDEIKENFHKKGKFLDVLKTRKGEDRAYIELTELETLWFNTGTRCNLACENCYIESSPTNDALVYITTAEVETYLDEIKKLGLKTTQIAFTGGEPFLNKDMIPMAEACLNRGFDVLILTNAFRAIDKHVSQLEALNEFFPGKLHLRVSLDHYTEEVHEIERGHKTFDKTLRMMKKLSDSKIKLSIAGRSLKKESMFDALAGYQKTVDKYQIPMKVVLNENITIFPEMTTDHDVPEITTGCWDILNVSPNQQMCAHERMVVKRKGADSPTVLPCTLIAYDAQFELGNTLQESFQKVYLNHPYCAQFCVLGGASCTGV